MELPGKEVVEVVDQRLGSRITTGILALAAVALVTWLVRYLYQSAVAGAALLLPTAGISPTWRQWIGVGSVVTLYGAAFWGFVVLARRIRKLEGGVQFQSRLNQVEKAEAETNEMIRNQDASISASLTSRTRSAMRCSIFWLNGPLTNRD